MALHFGKQITVADHAAFERLKQAGAKLAFVQRFQNDRIDNDSLWLMERANKIFAGAQVHAGLAADAGIHLCHHGSGNLDHRDAAHKNRSEKTSAVAHNAAAEGHQQRLAISLGIHQAFRQLLHRMQPLGRFSGGRSRECP